MTRIDFYILPAAAVEQRLDFTCRLAQKARQSGADIYIAVNSAAEVSALSERLWAFRPESFLPHDCEGEPSLRAPMAVGCGDDLGDHHDLLINLRDTIPEAFSRFERLAEVVCQEPGVLSNTREHYTFYQHRGYPIHTHKLNGP